MPDWLGSLRLDALRPRHFQRFYDQLGEDLCPRTLRQVHMTLYKALEDALQFESITRKPTEGVRLPCVPWTEMRWYSNEELGRLFESTEGDRFCAPWLVLGTLGVRLGEALGLKWSDIDWRRNTVTIRRTLQRNRLTGQRVLTETKTRGSRRTLTLPALT